MEACEHLGFLSVAMSRQIHNITILFNGRFLFQNKLFILIVYKVFHISNVHLITLQVYHELTCVIASYSYESSDNLSLTFMCTRYMSRTQVQ